MLEGMFPMKTADDVKYRLKQSYLAKLSFLIEFGNEEDIIAYSKAWNPRISKSELDRVTRLFRAAQLARARSPQPH